MRDFGQDLAIDGAGNSYVVGTFEHEAVFGAGEANETSLVSAGVIPSEDVFVAKYDGDGLLQWVRSIGGTDPSSGGNSGQDRAWGIAVDDGGNSYITGFLFRFTTLANFGNGVVLTAPGGFVAKYDTNGNVVWATALGDSTEGYSVAVAADGSLSVSGISPNPLVGGTAAAVWRLDATGSLQWMAQSVGGFANFAEVSLDAAGNTYATGRFDGEIVLGSGETNQTTLTSASITTDGVVAKYAADGELLWAKHMTSDIDVRGEAIALDSAANAYVSGSFNGNATFGPGEPNETLLMGSTVGDMFLAKFDASGSLLWVRHGAGPFNASGLAVVVDGGGGCWVTGYFGPYITFISEVGESISLSGQGGGDTFVARYSPDGAVLWATQTKSPGGNTDDAATGIGLDGAGNVYFSGYFRYDVTFGQGESNETELSSAGVADTFVAKLRSDTPNADLVITKSGAVTPVTAVVRNDGVVGAVEADPDTSNNFATAINLAALASNITYTVRVANNGPSVATGVVVIDRVGSGLQILSANPSQGSCNVSGQLVGCQLGSVAVGGGATITISARTN